MSENEVVEDGVEAKPNHHQHKCWGCGTIWEHSNLCKHNIKASVRNVKSYRVLVTFQEKTRSRRDNILVLMNFLDEKHQFANLFWQTVFIYLLCLLGFKTLFKYFPVYPLSESATCSGVPFATIFPPPEPPSGPMSII